MEIVATNTRQFTKSVAAGYNIATGYGMLFGKVAALRPFPGVALFVNYPHPEPTTKFGVQTSLDDYVLTTSDGLNDGRPHLLGAHREGTALEIRLDGVAQGRVTTLPDDVSAVGVPLYLGAHPENGMIIQQLQGDIAEVIVINGAIASSTFASLEADLKKKFGL